MAGIVDGWRLQGGKEGKGGKGVSWGIEGVFQGG